MCVDGRPNAAFISDPSMTIPNLCVLVSPPSDLCLIRNTANARRQRELSISHEMISAIRQARGDLRWVQSKSSKIAALTAPNGHAP